MSPLRTVESSKKLVLSISFISDQAEVKVCNSFAGNLTSSDSGIGGDTIQRDNLRIQRFLMFILLVMGLRNSDWKAKSSSPIISRIVYDFSPYLKDFSSNANGINLIC